MQAESRTDESVDVVSLRSDMIRKAADVHMLAFRGYMNTRLGHSYVRAFLRWFCSHTSAVALGAVARNGAVLGYVVGAPVGYAQMLNRAVLFPALGGVVVRPYLLLDPRFHKKVGQRLRHAGGRGKQAQQVGGQLPEPTMALVGIGVHPDARGRRIGQLLVRAFEREARALGMRSMRLSVYPDNTAAVRLYETEGWQENRSMTVHGQGAVYYTKVLNSDQ